MASTRADYLKALMESINANSNQQTGIPAQTVAQQTTESSQNKSGFDKLIGGAEEVADQMASGIFGFFEGFLDLGATAIGALGDATGWYSSKPFTDWAKHDLSGEFMDWKKTYLPSIWDSGVKLFRGDVDADYMGRMWSNLSNVFTGADDEQFNKNIEQDYLHDTNNFMTDNEVGQFAGGIVNSIGRMLPSIAIGNFAGAKGVTEAGAKLLSTSLMGGSSAGSSAVEALNDGANAGQALGYGAVSGAIEAGTEYIPFPGGNELPGLGLRKFSVKHLAKSMLEEGLEEVVSDAVNPLAKMIYKGTDALKDYTDPNYYKDVALSFAAGAISGGIMEGTSMAVNKAKYSNAGIDILNDYGDVVKGQMKIEADYGAAKSDFENGKIDVTKYEARLEEIAQNAIDLDSKSSEIIDRYNSLDQKYKDNINDFFKDVKAKGDANAEANKKTLDNRMQQLREEAAIKLALNDSKAKKAIRESPEVISNSASNIDSNAQTGAYNANQLDGDNQDKYTATMDASTQAAISGTDNVVNEFNTDINNSAGTQNSVQQQSNQETNFEKIEIESTEEISKAIESLNEANKENKVYVQKDGNGSFVVIEMKTNPLDKYSSKSQRKIIKELLREKYQGKEFKADGKTLKMTGEGIKKLSRYTNDNKTIAFQFFQDIVENAKYKGEVDSYKEKHPNMKFAYFTSEVKINGVDMTYVISTKENGEIYNIYDMQKSKTKEPVTSTTRSWTSNEANGSKQLDSVFPGSETNVAQENQSVNTAQEGQSEKNDSKSNANVNPEDKTHVTKTVKADKSDAVTVTNSSEISDYSKILDEQPRYVHKEEAEKATKAAYDYMSSPQKIQKDAAPNQTVTLKQAKNVATSEKAMIIDAMNQALSDSDADDIKFKTTKTDDQGKLYAAAADASTPAAAVSAMDAIFEDSLKNTKVYVEGKETSLYDMLDKNTLKSIQDAAHDLHQELMEQAKPSKQLKANKKIANLEARQERLKAKLDYFQSQLKSAKSEFSSKMELVREVDRSNKNIEITKRQYKIDQNRFPTEFKADGTFRSIVSSIPRTNLLIEKNSKIIRISDNNGTSLSSNKYMNWASNSMNAIQSMVNEGTIDSFTANPILEALNGVAYGAKEGDKHLNVEQIRSLTQAMKLLRYQLSSKAIESRVQLAQEAQVVNKQLTFVKNALPNVDSKVSKLFSMVFGENVKMMEFGDYFTGIDGSELQSRMNNLIEAREGYYKDYFDITDKYLKGEDVDKLKKMMKGKVTIDGKKVLKTEVLDLYMQLSDPDTRALMDNTNGKTTNRREIKFAKENFTIKYGTDTVQKLQSVLTADEISLAQKVFGNFYGDADGVYKQRVRKLQIDKMGDTTIPNSSEGYYPRKMSSDSTVRTNTLESLEKTMAAINPSNANVSKTRQTVQSIAVLESMDPLARADGYAGQVANELNMTYPTNDLLRMLGLNIVGEDGKTTRLQSTLGEQKTKWLRDFIATANGLELVKTDGLIKVVQKGMVTATLGINPINAMKNMISVFKEGYKVGAGPVIKTLMNPASWANNDFFKAVMETGTWKARYVNGILSMEADVGWDGVSGKVGEVTTYPYTFFDKVTTLAEAAIDYQYVKQSNPNLSKDELIKKAVDLWKTNVNITQSTAERMAKSQSSSGRILGRDSAIVKAAWTFGSDTVAGANMFFKDIGQFYTSSRIIKYADSILSDSGATQAMKDYATAMRAKALSTRKGIVSKRLPAAAGAMLLGAVLKYLIEELNQRVKGNKKFSDALFDGDTPVEIAKNTVASFVPFVETVTSAIDYNNGKLDLFAFSGIEDAFKAIGKLTKGKTRTGLVDLTVAMAQMAGIPVKNLYGFIVNGIVARFDPQMVVETKNLLYGAEASSTKYSDNYDMSLYERVGETSTEVKGELKTLNSAGYQVNPSDVYESYKDKNGNEKTVSWSDRQTMKRYYQKANARLASAMTKNSYKQLDDSERAYVINKLYKAYRQAALAKTVTKETPSDIITALAYANYGGIGELLTYVAHIKALEATNTSSKKQRAVSYVNSLGLSKSERMLVLKLAGYTVDDKYIVTSLRNAGYSTKEAEKIATA